jgi:hypothetical protein
MIHNSRDNRSEDTGAREETVPGVKSDCARFGNFRPLNHRLDAHSATILPFFWIDSDVARGSVGIGNRVGLLDISIAFLSASGAESIGIVRFRPSRATRGNRKRRPETNARIDRQCPLTSRN